MFLIKMAILSSRAPRTSSRGTARVAARPVSHGPDATGFWRSQNGDFANKGVKLMKPTI